MLTRSAAQAMQAGISACDPREITNYARFRPLPPFRFEHWVWASEHPVSSMFRLGASQAALPRAHPWQMRDADCCNLKMIVHDCPHGLASGTPPLSHELCTQSLNVRNDETHSSSIIWWQEKSAEPFGDSSTELITLSFPCAQRVHGFAATPSFWNALLSNVWHWKQFELQFACQKKTATWGTRRRKARERRGVGSSVVSIETLY